MPLYIGLLSTFSSIYSMVGFLRRRLLGGFSAFGSLVARRVVRRGRLQIYAASWNLSPKVLVLVRLGGIMSSAAHIEFARLDPRRENPMLYVERSRSVQVVEQVLV